MESLRSEEKDEMFRRVSDKDIEDSRQLEYSRDGDTERRNSGSNDDLIMLDQSDQ